MQFHLSPSFFLIANLMCFEEPTLEMQTYNWPCAKQGSLSQTPTFERVCPWDLLIVIANATRTGNCRRHHSKGYSLSLGFRVILGIKTLLLLCSPPAIVHSRRKMLCTLLKISLVPLHSPIFGLRLRISIRGIPGLMNSLWFGRPVGDNVLRYSTLYRWKSFALMRSSELVRIAGVPGN